MRNRQEGLDPCWPWEWTGTIFAPKSDVLEGGWLDGTWTQSAPSARGDAVVVTRVCDDQGRLVRVMVLDGPEPESRCIQLTYDGRSRLVALEDEAGDRAEILRYDYDESGVLVHETMLRIVRSISQVCGEASRSHDARGVLREVVVRDGAGRRLEENRFDDRGRPLEALVYDRVGRLSLEEEHEYDADGRIARIQRRRFGVDEHDGSYRAEGLQIEEFEYDPAAGHPVRRTLVEQEADDASRWRVATCEVIAYGPDHPGLPLSDQTIYYELGDGEEPRGRHRLVIGYHYDDDGRLLRKEVEESDLVSGETRRRTLVFSPRLDADRTGQADDSNPEADGGANDHAGRRLLIGGGEDRANGSS